jgi:hypothetical protein
MGGVLDVMGENRASARRHHKTKHARENRIERADLDWEFQDLS